MQSTLELVCSLEEADDIAEWDTVLEHLLNRCRVPQVREQFLFQEESDNLDILMYVIEVCALPSTIALGNHSAILKVLQILCALLETSEGSADSSLLGESESPTSVANATVILFHPCRVIQSLFNVLAHPRYGNCFQTPNVHRNALQLCNSIIEILLALFRKAGAIENDGLCFIRNLEWGGWKFPNLVTLMAFQYATCKSFESDADRLRIVESFFTLRNQIQGDHDLLLCVCHAILKVEIHGLHFVDGFSDFKAEQSITPLSKVLDKFRFHLNSSVVTSIFKLKNFGLIKLVLETVKRGYVGFFLIMGPATLDWHFEFRSSQTQAPPTKSNLFHDLILFIYAIFLRIRLNHIKASSVHDPTNGSVYGHVTFEYKSEMKSLVKQMEGILSSHFVYFRIDQCIDKFRDATVTFENTTAHSIGTTAEFYCNLAFFVSVFEQSRVLKSPQDPSEAGETAFRILEETCACLAMIVCLQGVTSREELIILSEIHKKLVNCLLRFFQEPCMWRHIPACIKILHSRKLKDGPRETPSEDETVKLLGSIFSVQTQKLQKYLGEWAKRTNVQRPKSTSQLTFASHSSTEEMERAVKSAHASDSGLAQLYTDNEAKEMEAFLRDDASRQVCELQSIASRLSPDSKQSESLKAQISFLCTQALPTSLKLSTVPRSILPTSHTSKLLPPLARPPTASLRPISRATQVLPHIHMK
ncbi:hypothetical protein BJ741DRAFT_589404 [Chytriomyces cf. hyalinus JEL632]|nr:hypothetical protein BJ741DRAFT_589404 [Chytriomyces cf. hyalinus JEL632]